MTTRKPASTTKTTTRKTATKATPKVEEVELIQEEAVETVEEKPVVKAQPKRAVQAQRINQDELIPCRSTQKNLIYVSKRTGERISWSTFGDVQYVAFGELVTMRGAQRRFLNDAWIIIEDEEAVVQLGLTKQYEDMFEMYDLEDFFSLQLHEMEDVLVKMPPGFKRTISNEAATRIKDGTLDSRSVIKLLETHLGIDLKIIE